MSVRPALSIDESVKLAEGLTRSSSQTGAAGAREDDAFLRGSRRRERTLLDPDAIPDTADLAAILRERHETSFSVNPQVLARRLRSRLRVMRRYTKHALDTSVAGLLLDIFNVILSLLACGLYVYEADTDETAWLSTCEVVLSAWFSFDYVLRLTIADNFLEAVLSRDMMIDLISIMPVFFSLFSQNNVQIFGILRVLKILRLLRVQRLLSYFGDDEVMKQGFFMMLTFTFVIFFGAGVYHYVENRTEALRSRFLSDNPEEQWENDDEQRESVHFFFGTAAYFVVVTMTTVGFGDITPSTSLSQFVAAVMIMTTIIVVPFQTNELLNRISDQSVWNKKKYTPKAAQRHVVVAGTVNSNGLAYFVDEFFNADQLLQAEELIIMVVMAPCPPGPDVLELLQDPHYSSQLLYISGSVLSPKDLARASAMSAEAIWLLSDKFAENPGEEDALTIIRSLQLNRYLQANVSDGMTLPAVYTQLIQPENRTKLTLSTSSVKAAKRKERKQLKQAARMRSTKNASFVSPKAEKAGGETNASMGLGATSSGVVEEQDNDAESGGEAEDLNDGAVLCLNELKMVILARSCTTPGLFTLVNNLVTSGSDSGQAKLSTPWEREYLEGGDHEIYRVKLAESFDGLNFFQVAVAAYDAFRVVLIAVEQGGSVRVAPHNLVIDCSQDAYGYVITEDSGKASQVESFEKSVGTSARNSELRPRIDTRSSSRGNDTTGSFSEGTPREPTDGSGADESKSPPPRSLMSAERKALIRKKMSLVAQQNIALSKWRRGNVEPDSPGTPMSPLGGENSLASYAEDCIASFHFSARKRTLREAELFSADELLPEGKHWDDIPSSSRHIVLCGSAADMYHFVLTLRRKKQSKSATGAEEAIIPIVLLVPNGLTQTMWNRVANFPMIFFIAGSPLSTEDLMRAGVEFAQHAVVFAGGQHSKLTVSEQSPEAMKALQEMEAMADADTIFINSALHALNPDLHVVSELVHNSNMSFLNEVHLQPNSENVLGGPWFASGHVYVSSLNDYLSAQLYHNPRLVTLLEKVIVGDSSNGEDRPDAQDGTTVELLNPFDLPPRLNGSKLLPGSKWRVVYSHVLRHRAVPIGLYRGISAVGEPSDFGNRLPYVFTNPPADAIVRAQDRVFILMSSLSMRKLQMTSDISRLSTAGECASLRDPCDTTQSSTPEVATSQTPKQAGRAGVPATDGRIDDLNSRVQELEALLK